MMTNNPQSGAAFPFQVTLLIETLASGNIAASIFEFPQCRVEAPNRERAIRELKTTFLERVDNIEAFSWNVPAPTPAPAWLKFAGIFRDDPDFYSIATSLQAERNLDDESEVDPTYYL